MLEKIKEEKRQYWLEIIHKQESSNKVALHWCKENNINSKAFYRWGSYFSNQEKSTPKINLDSFIELPNNSTGLEIEVEYKKYKFKLKNLDFQTLQNFILLLKGL